MHHVFNKLINLIMSEQTHHSQCIADISCPNSQQTQHYTSESLFFLSCSWVLSTGLSETKSPNVSIHGFFLKRESCNSISMPATAASSKLAKKSPMANQCKESFGCCRILDLNSIFFGEAIFISSVLFQNQQLRSGIVCLMCLISMVNSKCKTSIFGYCCSFTLFQKYVRFN